MSIAAGTRLGPYEIQSALGAGGMGEVWRARDTHLQRDVAIKILPDAFALDPDRLSRFRREAQLLASLNHPNIAAIYGFEEADDVHALVLELVAGPTLADRIAQGPIPLDEALPIARQIAEALEAAHEQGIVHRDLKPSNIKVRPDGTVKVLDFGLAKLTESGATAASGAALSMSPTITSPAVMGTAVGVILGTAAYMSPEQARGRAVDKRTDIWAFGCVLYEMLTGARAFGGEDVADTMAAVLRGDPDWTKLPSATPFALRRVLQRCLERDHRKRVQDVAAAIFLFDELNTDDEGSGQRAAAHARGRTRSTVIGVIAVSIGVAVGMLLKGGGSSSAVPRDVTRFQIPTTGTSTATRHRIALSADGRHLAVARGGLLHHHPLDAVESTPIAGTDGAWEPFFSPDGQWIGFWQAGKLMKARLAGGAPVTLCAADNLYGATWTNDNSILFGQGAKGIWRVSADGGMPEALISIAPHQTAHGPQMLDDGDTVLFTLGDQSRLWDDADIVAASLKSGVRRTVLHGGADARLLPSGHLLYARSGILFGTMFDLDTLTTRGEAVPLVERVDDNGRNSAGPSALASGAAQFAISRTGTLAYSSGAVTISSPRRLLWVDRHGKETDIKAPPHAYLNARISPDGSRVALSEYDAGANVWVLDLRRESLTRLTVSDRDARGTLFGALPVWTPDGRALVFHSNREGAGIVMYRQPADGTSPAERLTTGGNIEEPQAFAPDGTLLFGESIRGASFDLRVLLPGPKAIVRTLMATPHEERRADVSPDGRFIAYQSNESGRAEAYVRPFPNVDSGRWQVSSAGGFSPAWARSGRELFFVAPGGAMMSMNVSLGSTPTFGVPSVLFRGDYFDAGFVRSYDVSPDGDRFLMIKRVDANESPRIVVALNWVHDLERRVPVNQR